MAESLNPGSGLANGGTKLVFNLKRFLKGYRYFGRGEGPCGMKEALKGHRRGRSRERWRRPIRGGGCQRNKVEGLGELFRVKDISCIVSQSGVSAGLTGACSTIEAGEAGGRLNCELAKI